jgi:hypothetical protein
MNKLVMPQINLNGSSPEFLMEQYTELHRALDAALGNAYAAMPHGRDYQLHDNYSEARRSYETFIASLNEYREDVMGIMEHIQDAIDERESRRKR